MIVTVHLIFRYQLFGRCAGSSGIHISPVESVLYQVTHQRIGPCSYWEKQSWWLQDLPLQGFGRMAETELWLQEIWDAKLEAVSRGCQESGQCCVWEDCQSTLMLRWALAPSIIIVATTSSFIFRMCKENEQLQCWVNLNARYWITCNFIHYLFMHYASRL